MRANRERTRYYPEGTVVTRDRYVTHFFSLAVPARPHVTPRTGTRSDFSRENNDKTRIRTSPSSCQSEPSESEMIFANSLVQVNDIWTTIEEY